MTKSGVAIADKHRPNDAKGEANWAEVAGIQGRFSNDERTISYMFVLNEYSGSELVRQSVSHVQDLLTDAFDKAEVCAYSIVRPFILHIVNSFILT